MGGVAQISHDRRARRRDPLAGDSVVDRQEALEQDCGRGGRRGQPTMRAADPARTQRKRPHRPADGVDLGDQPGRSDDVGDRIPSADFVETNLFRIDSMNPRLGRRQMREDRDRMLYRFAVEPRSRQRFAYVTPVHVRMAVRVIESWSAASVLVWLRVAPTKRRPVRTPSS